MNSALFGTVIVSLLGWIVREVGAGWRQRSALGSLERLAERNPDSAMLVPRVVKAVARPRARRAAHRLRRR